MTYHSDPARWTRSPGDAPELLRGGLEAAGREGPSERQMHALALKLAAFGAGAAVATSAASAQASTTAAGTGLAATGSSVLTKVAVSVALIGAVATGGALLIREPAPSARESAPSQQVESVQHARPSLPPESAASQRAKLSSPSSGTKLAPTVAAAAPPVEVARVEPRRADAPAVAPASDAMTRAELSRAERRERRHARAQTAEAERAEAERTAAERTAAERAEVATAETAPKLEIVQVEGRKAQPSEIDLLSRARSALASRPREAYRLTEEHKRAYPEGLFAQERDALAVEAVQRAGDLERARQLAESFLQRYPSSPAAHRFRETMGLP